MILNGISAITRYFLKKSVIKNGCSRFERTSIRFDDFRIQRMKQYRLAFLGAALILILVGGLWLATVLKRKNKANVLQNVDAKSPFEKKELKGLIDALSSPNEDERKRAESDLANAGVFADSALKSAEATATGPAKEAIQRLINRRRFAGLQDLDYTKAFPKDSFVYLQVPSIQDAIAKAEKTPFGRFIKRPALAGVRSSLWEKMRRDDSGKLRQPPVDYLKGQVAVGWFDPAEIAKRNIDVTTKLGVLVELKGVDPQGEFLEWSGTMLASGATLRDYKNIETLEAGGQNGAIARTGNTILFGSDTDALHTVIDTVLTRRSMSENVEMKAISKALGASPDAWMVIDIPGIANEILLTQKAANRKPQDDLVELIVEKFGFAGASSVSIADGFEDRVACLLPAGPGAVLDAITAPDGTPAPLASFNIVPSDAVAAAMVYVDGSKLEAAVKSLYEDVRKMQAPGTLPPANEAGPFIPLRVAEKLLGVKEGGIVGLIKGEIGVWIELKGNEDINSADISGFVTTVDSKSAEEAALILEKINALQLPGVLTKTDFKNHTIRSVNPARSGEAGRAFTWMVEKNRVYFASSIQSMKRQLDSVQARMPGLLKREPVQKALSGFAAADQTGNVFYVDTQIVLRSWAESNFQKIATDPFTPLEVKDALTQLPPPVDLVKDFPPLLAFTGTRKDRADMIVRGPLPLIPLVLGGLLIEREKPRSPSTIPAETKLKR